MASALVFSLPLPLRGPLYSFQLRSEGELQEDASRFCNTEPLIPWWYIMKILVTNVHTLWVHSVSKLFSRAWTCLWIWRSPWMSGGEVGSFLRLCVCMKWHCLITSWRKVSWRSICNSSFIKIDENLWLTNAGKYLLFEVFPILLNTLIINLCQMETELTWPQWKSLKMNSLPRPWWFWHRHSYQESSQSNEN